MGGCFSKSSAEDKDKEPDEVLLKQFTLMVSIGRGAFGKVRVVQRKSDKKLYAMKYINKRKCIEQKAVNNTVFERNLLEDLRYPLMVNLRYAFQDDENMFMVMDLMLGGDLKHHINTFGGFDERCIKVYAAEVSSALVYLHAREVVHRDVKPENLLLSADGHVHLTDFNVAAYLPPNGEVLNSISGTLAYMAPEVIIKKGYRESADWWSLGVTLFELMYGKRPFRGRNGKELCSKIIEGNYEYPETRRSFSDECLDFVNGLLQKNVEYRLGVGTIGVQRLKTHPFFKGIKWDDVPLLKLNPPFKPSRHATNFNPMLEAEDVLLEENKLKPNRRKSMAPSSLQDPELYKITTKFRDYNYKKALEEEEACARKEQLIEESRMLEMKLEEQDEDFKFGHSDSEREHNPTDDEHGDIQNKEHHRKSSYRHTSSSSRSSKRVTSASHQSTPPS